MLNSKSLINVFVFSVYIKPFFIYYDIYFLFFLMIAVSFIEFLILACTLFAFLIGLHPWLDHSTHAIYSRTVRSFQEAALRGGCPLETAASGLLVVGLVGGRVAVVVVSQRPSDIGHSLWQRVSVALPLGVSAAGDSSQILNPCSSTASTSGIIGIGAGAAGGVHAVEATALRGGIGTAAVARVNLAGPALATAQLFFHGMLAVQVCYSMHCWAVLLIPLCCQFLLLLVLFLLLCSS